MSQYIDARNTRYGIRFRIFSTITDTYITGVLTEGEMRDQLLFNAIENALDDYTSSIDRRINNAQTKGSSMKVTEAALDSDWQKELKHKDLPPKVLAQYRKEQSERMARYKVMLKKMFDEGWFDPE